MKQRKSVFIGLGLLTALFVTAGAFAGESAQGSPTFNDQTNTNGNMKMKKAKKSKGNSNMMNSNMMNSNMAPNPNGTPQ